VIVGGLLKRSAQRWPDADALIEDETVLTRRPRRPDG
jgi:hypothetical protein